MFSRIKTKIIIKVLSLLIIIIGVVGLFVFNPVDFPLSPKCPFKMLTGLSCPGCGFQRAVHAFLHGRFYEAISYNFFMIISIPYLCVLVLVLLMPEGERKKRWYPIVFHRALAYTYIVLFFVWLVVRNIWNL